MLKKILQAPGLMDILTKLANPLKAHLPVIKSVPFISGIRNGNDGVRSPLNVSPIERYQC